MWLNARNMSDPGALAAPTEVTIFYGVEVYGATLAGGAQHRHNAVRSIVASRAG